MHIRWIASRSGDINELLDILNEVTACLAAAVNLTRTYDVTLLHLNVKAFYLKGEGVCNKKAIRAQHLFYY